MSFKRKPVDVLTPEEVLAQMKETPEEVREEYKKLRHRAEQRLRDLKAAGMTGSRIYQDWVNRFPRLTEIGPKGSEDKQLLADAMAEVTRFLHAKLSTPGGQRAAVAAIREQMEEEDYDEAVPQTLPWDVFGELMRGIKTSARAEQFYGKWQRSYRNVIARAERAGLSMEKLSEALQLKQIRIGPGGGLWDVQRGKRIQGKWAAME